MSVEKTSTEIAIMCRAINDLLQDKNAKYGNTIAEPIEVFSHLSPKEGMLVRIDDKLARIKNCEKLRKNDVIDLIGYLIRLSIEEGWTDLGEFYE